MIAPADPDNRLRMREVYARAPTAGHAAHGRARLDLRTNRGLRRPAECGRAQAERAGLPAQRRLFPHARVWPGRAASAAALCNPCCNLNLVHPGYSHRFSSCPLCMQATSSTGTSTLRRATAPPAPTLHTYAVTLIVHGSLVTAHYSLVTSNYSPLTTHYSLPTAHESLLITRYMLQVRAARSTPT